MQQDNGAKEILIRVSNSTDIIKLKHSITSAYEADKKRPIIIRSIGAGALNQAIKGVILSSAFFFERGLKPALTPYFKDVSINTSTDASKVVTAIEFKVSLTQL